MSRLSSMPGRAAWSDAIGRSIDARLVVATLTAASAKHLRSKSQSRLTPCAAVNDGAVDPVSTVAELTAQRFGRAARCEAP